MVRLRPGVVMVRGDGEKTAKCNQPGKDPTTELLFFVR